MSIDTNHDGAGAGPRRGAARSNRRGPLQDALDAYRRGADRASLDDRAARELRVLELVAWLQGLEVPKSNRLTEALNGAEFTALTAGVGAATAQAARVYAGDRETRLPEADTAAPDDRMTLGLLAYLCGDPRTCELAWAAAGNAGNDPLVDAGLGRLLLNDDMPEEAYTRLLQARQHLPHSASLTLALAEAALQRGDLRRARSWMAELPPDADSYRRALLELDLRATATPGADLSSGYLALARVQTPGDPTPRFRIAQLALRRGDLAAAEAQLEDLVRTWPELPALRLARARVALHRRDLPGYGQQVLAVLERDFGRGRSRGSVAHYLEVLRLGGLESLYLEGIERTAHESTGQRLFGAEIPIAGFAPARVIENFCACARLLEWLRRESSRRARDGRRIDEFSELLLERLPLLAQRIPALASPSPLRALALRLMPALAPAIYEILQPTVRRLLIDLHYDGWQRVPLQRLDRPADVPLGTVFGGTLRAVPDATGDGIRDLLVSSTASHPQRGESRVLLVDSRTMAVVASLSGDSPHHLFGFALDAAGDLDGDGVHDWLIGSPSGSSDDQQGHVELWSGATRCRIALLRGDGPGFGASVAGIGDRDGDGCADFAVATVPIVRNQTPQGDVRVYSGRTHALLATWHNEVPGIWFGAWMDNVGDANGDGFDDIVVGGNYGDAAGFAGLYDGRSDSLLHSWTLASTTAGFAARVAGVGDLDGDGHADVAVSAHGPLRQQPDQITYYSGRTGQLIFASDGQRSGDGFGMAVLRYPCPRGAPIVAIGSPQSGEPMTGRFHVKAVDGSVDCQIVGPRIRGGFGWSMAAVDDLDGDGLAELFVAGTANGDDGIVWRVSSRAIPQLDRR